MYRSAWKLQWGGLQSHTVAFVCIVISAFTYLWPLISQLTTVIPGRPELTDVTENIWAVGWVQFSLTQPTNLITTDYLFVPFEIDLRLHAYGLLEALMAFPFTFVLGVIGAYNLILVATFTLNGIVAYGLIYSVVKHSQAALVSATFLMLSGALVWHFIAGRLGLPALWTILASIWSLRELLMNPSLMKGVFLGLFLSAATLSDLHLLLFTMIWIGFHLTYHFFRQRTSFDKKHFLALGTAILVWGILFVPYYGIVLLQAGNKGYAIPRLIDLASYSFQLRDYVDVEMIPYIYGFDFLIGTVGALVLYRRRGGYQFWTISSIAFLLLALGPYLMPTKIPLPMAAVSLWPPAMQFRTPYRFVMPASIGLAITTAFTSRAVLTRLRSAFYSWVLVISVIAVRLLYANGLLPFETQTYPDYNFYHQARLMPGDFALLEVPFGIRSGLDQIGNGGEAMQYYQHIHHKRILNGSVARLPVIVFEFYRSHPALKFLAGEFIENEDDLPADFADVLSWSKAKFVIVHRSILTPARAERIESFLLEQPQLELHSTESDLIIYHVK